MLKTKKINKVENFKKCKHGNMIGADGNKALICSLCPGLSTTDKIIVKVPKVKSYSVVKFDSEEDWKSYRLGKITGTTRIVAAKGGMLQDAYQIMIDRLGLTEDQEDDRERGKRLEPQCLEVFEKETGKKVNRELIIWQSKKNPNLTISPDGWINDKEATEFKCPNLVNYAKVLVEQKVPSEYFYQMLQYFIINKELETLYFGFYNPFFTLKPFFYLTIKREEYELDFEVYEEKLEKMDEEINNLILKLSNF